MGKKIGFYIFYIGRVCIAAILLLTLSGCRIAAETICLDRPDVPRVDFAELAAFSFFDGHITYLGDIPARFHVREIAEFHIIGNPYTEYHLSIILASGPSGASGLGYTMSDSEGRASWSWRVSWNTRPGRYSAVILGGGDRLVMDIIIEPDE